MPRADRLTLTAKGLAIPPVDHLSNKGTLNVLLDRTFSGLPAGLPPDRTMFGLFMNFSRLTDKALREYDAARAELLLYVSPHDGELRISPYLRAVDHMENCVRRRRPRRAEREGAPGQQDRPFGTAPDQSPGPAAGIPA